MVKFFLLNIFPVESFIYCSLSIFFSSLNKTKNKIETFWTTYFPHTRTSYFKAFNMTFSYFHGAIRWYPVSLRNHWHYFNAIIKLNENSIEIVLLCVNGKNRVNSIKTLKRLTKQLSSMEKYLSYSLDGILIRPILYAHIYNNLQVNLLYTE